MAHVDDVAAGQVLALERGQSGRSYILGGENVTLQALLEDLARITGLPAPHLKAPRAVVVLVAGLSEAVEGRLLRRHPSVPEAARMSTSRMSFDDSRARLELGYSPRLAAEALEDSARWFIESGKVAARRMERIRWWKGTPTPRWGEPAPETAPRRPRSPLHHRPPVR